ncbi:uncharacterized protein L3040_006594 [Drepanopeziza brunnea f. sp. 'multigermtubi']|uniref:Short chain dehydrogenase/reductase n=1 Tax=Marssonina brunnea f. sp. multigermtubi (strain MB_m1) TaxID=1072389 RepID=K1XXF0_MARBU|nr:short chain dehydrogenase/reductase [Drepanopeziza brunnea f. sp. 'multigermtubi' MB_m1]EKD17479.1 short chain dehydrogenase/reductase [Drepanopeziza brunnea f. sp. 'multigermtubi' MB_m1]KAJ5038916.1 hypothetical protein L3040_006594 [Drepanopeziza brunnea f. sp. 'multigermtubi']
MATSASNDQLKSSHLFDVSNFSALITGGGSGIGLMITETLAANGAKVYITGRRKEALETVVKEYNTGPGKIIALPGDVSKKDEVARLVKEIESQEPNGIHLLVNNAGIARDDNTKYSNSKPDFKSAQSISEHLMKSDPQAWAETFSTNVTSQFFVSAAFLPLVSNVDAQYYPLQVIPISPGARVLAKSLASTPGSSPSIINITSISGVMKGSSAGQFAYASSKAAFLHLTRMMATTFAETHVRVNSIAPGLFPSEMTVGGSDERQKSELKSKASNPSGRYGREQDMGACVLLLAGPGGGFLNGQVIYPEGGNLLVQPACV